MKPKLCAGACALAFAALAPATGATAQTPEYAGKIVYDSDGSIFTFDPSTSQGPREVEPDDDVLDVYLFDPTLSPDRATIAFAREVGGDQDIWTMSAAGSDPRRLTRSTAEDWGPAWSPEGSRIAFTRSRAGKSSICVVTADGRRLRRVETGVARSWRPDWSPDGRRIAFTGAQKGDVDVFTVRLDGSGLRRLTRGPRWEDHPAWSPDGSRVAFVRDDPVLAEKPFVVDARGGDRDRVALSDCDDECYVEDVAWTPEGDLAVTYGDETDFEWEIVVTRRDGTETPVLGWGWSIATLSWR